MNKTLMVAMLATCIGLSASADTVTEVYYGSAANDSVKNPCKGECVTVCATKKKTVESLQGVTVVTETVYRGNGHVLNRCSSTTYDAPEIVVADILMSTPNNAIATVTSDDEEPCD